MTHTGIVPSCSGDDLRQASSDHARFRGMKIIRNGSGPEQDRTDAPLFVGGKVTGQSIVSGDSDWFSFNLVSFAAGARNKFHTHTSDQILYVTSGIGIVANESEEVEVTEGDTALIPAGEKHWHGATADSDFAHISLTAPDSQTEMFDD